jgi:uracil phosphoribosyltransferase
VLVKPWNKVYVIVAGKGKKMKQLKKYHVKKFYRSVRIGKILIQRDEETHQPKVNTHKKKENAKLDQTALNYIYPVILLQASQGYCLSLCSFIGSHAW